jgi:hypothetical protein
MYRQFTKKTYRTKSKYNNRSKQYNGKTFDSIKEANHAEELDWRIKAGEVKEWVHQYKIPLAINGRHIANYYVDFKVILADDDIEYHEVKGFETEVWRLKWKMTEALYPDYNLVVIK